MIGDELLDLVEVTDEEMEAFLQTLFGPSRMEDDTDLTGIRRSNEPSVSYRKVINLYIEALDGQKCSVAICPARDFAVLMQVALTTIPEESDQAATARAIDGLDYSGEKGQFDKWYAISELVDAGATIPLFSPTKEPVSLSHGPRKPGRSHEDLLASEASSRGAGYQGIDPTQEYHLALPRSL